MKVYRTINLGREIRRTYDILLSKWGCETQETNVATSYGSTHVVVCGDPGLPPLVLFHGVGDDSALMWIYNAAYLSKHFRIYAVDTIGGPGKSDPGSGYDSSFDDIKWIDEVLDGVGVESAFFAGVSHGGYLVQAYALNRPDRVRRAVSISGSVPAGTSGSPMKTMLKIFLPEALLPTKRNVEKLIKKLCGENSAAFTGNPAIMEHYQYLLKGFNNMAMSPHKVRNFSDAEIDSIRGKVIYLVGLDDPFEKLGGEEALRKYRMNAEFYKGAGHGLNHEKADEMNRRIADILLAE